MLHPAPVPDTWATPDLLLRPLTTQDVESDYEAVMSSVSSLRNWEGTDWPRTDFTLEENLADLERHEREHLAGDAFTYTVTDPSGDLTLGCVYIRPLRRDGPDAPPDVPGVWFWARDDHPDIEPRLLTAIREWLAAEWSFPTALFATNENLARQVVLLTLEGFALQHAVTKEHVRGRLLFYG